MITLLDFIILQEDFYEWGSEGTLSLVKNMESNVRLLAASARQWRQKIQEEKQVKKIILHFSPFSTLLLYHGFGYNTAKSCLPNCHFTVIFIRKYPFITQSTYNTILFYASQTLAL